MELHEKKLNLNISTKQFNITDEQEVATIEGYASKMYQEGKPVTDLDQEMVSTSNFRLDAKRLLLNHELDEAVGHIELEQRPDGIYLRGKVYKDTMKDQDWARLKRGLFDFSIGFIAEEAEYRNIEGKEVLVFTKGVVYEVSLVAIPSNKFATLDVVKSIQTEKGFGLECSIDNIKSMNPNMDCSCLNGLKQEAQEKQIQGENMEREIQEEVTKEVNTESTTDVTPTEQPTETPTVETTEEVKPEVKETVETQVEETKEEVKTEVTEQSQEQIITTEATAEVISNETNNDEKSETNELANTLDFKQETIDILTADLGQLDVDKIRALYDTLADKLDKVGALQAFQALQKIEQYVENELQSNS